MSDSSAVLPEVLHPNVTGHMLGRILYERMRQDAKWGEQNHPDGTGPRKKPLYELAPHDRDGYSPSAARITQLARRNCDAAAQRGELTWRDILLEEVFEALAEDDPARLREELVQVAAVAAAWTEAIDRRAARDRYIIEHASDDARAAGVDL